MAEKTTKVSDLDDFDDDITSIRDYARVIREFSEKSGDIPEEHARIIYRMAWLITDAVKPMMAALEPK